MLHHVISAAAKPLLESLERLKGALLLFQDPNTDLGDINLVDSKEMEKSFDNLINSLKNCKKSFLIALKTHQSEENKKTGTILI